MSEKKVDESWKESVEREKQKVDLTIEKEVPPVSELFMGFLNSMGYQCLIHLGDLENPGTGERTPNMEAAQETIDLISCIKDKTKGNLNPQEEKMLTQLLADLQQRFARSSS